MPRADPTNSTSLRGCRVFTSSTKARPGKSGPPAPPRAPDEQPVVARVPRLPLLPQGKAREEVAARPAAGDEQPHRCAPAPRRRKPPGPPLTESIAPAPMQEVITDDIP